MPTYDFYDNIKEYKIGKVTTSDAEIKQILLAWFAISLAFGIVLSSGSLFSLQFLINFAIAALTVGIGFLLHELGHKVMAQHYGYFAEFRSFNVMLILAVAMSFLGFIFAAPGAVFIASHSITVRKNGIISIIGAVINLCLAIIFLLISGQFTGFLGLVGAYGFLINSWLALFNMIPVWNFDGAKVFRWSKAAWITIVLIAGFFVFVVPQLIDSLVLF